LIGLLTLRDLRYKFFLRDALFSPQTPAASPKLFSCYVTVVTRKLALDALLNFSQVIRYRFSQQNEAVAQMTARATKSALELVGEFLFGSTRQVQPKKHPIEHLPLPFSKRAAFFLPVVYGARADCVLLRELAVTLDIFLPLVLRSARKRR
jgi:hypothetical protein